MRTCSNCNTQSPDKATHCINCNADLGQFAATAVALKRFQENSRVRDVRIVVHHDACPACQKAEGTYQKDIAPDLPVEGCSHRNGCRCFYEPMLNVIYP